MCRCAHRAVLTGRVDRRIGALLNGHVVRCPSGNREFRMLRVIAAGDAIMILEQNSTIRGYENRPEGLVSTGERLGRQIDGALKMFPIDIINHQLTSRAKGKRLPWPGPCPAKADSGNDCQ